MTRSRRLKSIIAIVAVAALTIAVVGVAVTVWASQRPAATAQGIHKIKHVVIIMQENRSFDSYFGTYPGADGIPRDAKGNFTVCLPNPKTKGCDKPYHDRADLNLGGPHGALDVKPVVDGGKMDGFVKEILNGGPGLYPRPAAGTCVDPFDKRCMGGYPPDVMGYHDGRELPNYWAYAKNFVLQDRMFSPVASWSAPASTYLVSGWSAKCARRDEPRSCSNALFSPDVILPSQGDQGATVPTPNYAWTDITDLLNKHGVSWKNYVADGTGAYCATTGPRCKALPQKGTPEIWNSLAYFTDVRQGGKLGNIQTITPPTMWQNRGIRV